MTERCFRQSRHGKTAVSAGGIESIHTSAVGAASSFCTASSATANCERSCDVKIHFRYQSVIEGLTQIAANLAAFASACPLFVAALRGACHPQQIRPGDAESAIREQDFCCRNEGIRCVNFSWHSPCCRSRFRPDAFAQQQTQRNAGGAEGLHPRRAALLPSGDRPGRFHHPGLPAAASSQDQRRLRPGSEEPRAISRVRAR